MPPARPQPHPRSFLSGLLSYLVPGLGQIYQGRVGKGLLFLLSIYGLFFYGQALGSWKNVYLPDTSNVTPPIRWLPFGRVAADLYNRVYFAGQFWVGAAAWPALWHYLNYDHTQFLSQMGLQVADRQLAEELRQSDGVLVVSVDPDGPAARAGLQGMRRNEAGRSLAGDMIVSLDGNPIRSVDYLYSALETHQSGDEVTITVRRDSENQNLQMALQPVGGFSLKTYQRTPPEEEINKLQTNGDKTWDLGWIYTVIAGVLNILVIYDAFAGPALVDKQPGGEAAAA